MNHYLAEKLGRMMTKHELIADPPPMMLEDFVSVSKLSMCFQVTIALSAPQITLYVHFFRFGPCGPIRKRSHGRNLP
jgi:hypothetical protein